MSEARAIGEIVAPILERAVRLRRFQTVLTDVPDPARRKRIIMLAREVGAITGEDASLLLQAHQLETA